MRSLIYVPIVHTELDMGSLAGRLEDVYRARFGAAKWEERVRTIREVWRGIEGRISALKINLGRVKVYQDGLPVCGREEEIVRDLARQGSLNHRLVAQLMDRGAKLMGTESPELLLREYRLVKSQLGGGAEESATGAAGTEKNAQTTLQDRDRFIARRIEETLAEGETGVLFMGFAHEVHRYLSDSIKVQFLIHRLPFGKDFGLRGKRDDRRGDGEGE